MRGGSGGGGWARQLRSARQQGRGGEVGGGGGGEVAVYRHVSQNLHKIALIQALYGLEIVLLKLSNLKHKIKSGVYAYNHGVYAYDKRSMGREPGFICMWALS